VITPPKCSCSARSKDGHVFTCSDCVGAALRFWSGEKVDQHEMFEYVDRESSVRGLAPGDGDMTHISDVLKGLAEADPFPF